jgi:hypothetical protein
LSNDTYVGVPPLYKVERGRKFHYCFDDSFTFVGNNLGYSNKEAEIFNNKRCCRNKYGFLFINGKLGGAMEGTH